MTPMPLLRSWRSLPPRSLVAWLACVAVLAVAGASIATDPAIAVARSDPAIEPSPTSTAPLRLGVEAEALPVINPSRRYTEEGHEVALGRALGERLGVVVEFVALPREAFANALADGGVDAVLTRVAAPVTAGAGATVTTATGYHSGIAAAMRTDTPVRHWQDLAGRTVCLSRAHDRAAALARKLGARVDVHDTPAQALVQLRLGHCDAALHDQAQLDALFQRPEWRKFSATLAAVAPADLVLVTDRAPGAGRARSGAQQGARGEALRRALEQEVTATSWSARNTVWAANVAFEVYFDQLGPDCH